MVLKIVGTLSPCVPDLAAKKIINKKARESGQKMFLGNQHHTALILRVCPHTVKKRDTYRRDL